MNKFSQQQRATDRAAAWQARIRHRLPMMEGDPMMEWGPWPSRSNRSTTVTTGESAMKAMNATNTPDAMNATSTTNDTYRVIGTYRVNSANGATTR